nr:hypothetical protein [Tanacetum cinerariifolium]
MSDSEDSTVTYTTVSSPYEGRSGDVSPGVDGPPVMPEDPYAYVVVAFQALPPPNYVSGPEEPEQAPPSPVYIHYVRSRCTQTDYPVDHDDEEEEEEPSRDDADEEDEEQDEDDDDGKEEHPASTDSIPPPPALRVTARIPFRPQPPTLSFTKEDAERADRPEVTLPPRKRLSIVHCPRYEAGESSVAAAARPIEGRRADYGLVDSVEAEIRRRRAEDIRYGVNTWVTELAAMQEQDTQDIYRVMEDTQATLTTQLSSLQGHLATDLGEIRALQAREQARAGAP